MHYYFHPQNSSYAMEAEFQRRLFSPESSPPSYGWYTSPLLRHPHQEQSSSSRNWLHLPVEVTLIIFEKLEAIEVLTTAQRVCMLWRTICKDLYTWRVINMRICGAPKFFYYQLSSLCCRTIERSCGLLVELSIDYFADDDLLTHIANSCGSRLRRLRLNKCYHDCISNKVLCALAKKCPLLEELDIIHYCYRILPSTLESFGQACPLLKTFKFNSPQLLHDHYDSHWPRRALNADAYAIARSMPQLRHLQLLDNRLDYDGLHSILNGCPHLKFLDLRHCSKLDTTREIIIKMLQGRIMYLRLPVPGASTRENEFCSLLGYEKEMRNSSFNILVEEWHMFQASIKNEKIAKLGLVVKYEDEEVWEDIDIMWITLKNRRRHRRESTNHFKVLQRSRRRKEHRTVSKRRKKYGKKANKIDLRSMWFGEEL